MLQRLVVHLSAQRRRAISRDEQIIPAHVDICGRIQYALITCHSSEDQPPTAKRLQSQLQRGSKKG